MTTSPQNDPGIYTYHNSGFDINLPTGMQSINWADIERLQAYKSDWAPANTICMNITVNNHTIMVTEHLQGWEFFIAQLPTHLSPINPNWETSAQATTLPYDLVTIYERADRIMPPQPNFSSHISNITAEELSAIMQQHGWIAYKNEGTGYHAENSRTDLDMEDEQDGTSLHGRIAFHPSNTEWMDDFFKTLNHPYHFRFYDNDGNVIVQADGGHSSMND